MSKIHFRGVNFKNFKSIELANFEIKSNVTGIYGENGIGKTSVVQAIELLQLDFGYSSGKVPFEALVHDGTRKDPFEYIESLYKSRLLNGKNQLELTYEFGIDNFVYQYSKHLVYVDNKCKEFEEKITYYNTNKKEKKYTILNRAVDRDMSTTLFNYELFDKVKYIEMTDLTTKGLTKLSSLYSDVLNIIDLVLDKKEVTTNQRVHLENIKKISKFIIDATIIKIEDQQVYGAGVIPLNVHLYYEGMEAHGKIPLIQDVHYYSEKEIEAICDTFDSINTILAATLSGRKLELSKEKTSVSESGEKKSTIQILVVQPTGSKVSIDKESTGILKLISILAALVELMRNKNYLLIIDELDAHVYEYLLSILINELSENIIGTFIFTSHNLTLFESLDAQNISIIQRNPENNKVDFVFLKKANKNTNLRNLYIRSLYLGVDDIYETNIDDNKLFSALKKAMRKGKNV